MSQLIVVKNENGIVLAAENQVLQLDEEGKEITFQINRLLPLTAHSALLTAGSAEGVEMGNTLKRFIQEEGLKDVQDIHEASLAFLSSEYERFMTKKCELLPLDPIHQVSFILAGKSEKDPLQPFRLYYLWTKKKLPRLDADEISLAFSLPRRMGLEYQLNKISSAKGSVAEMLAGVKTGMERLKEKEEISFPVSYATITMSGYQVA